MAETHLSYKGKDIGIDQPDEDHARVTIEDRVFEMTRHGGNLPMWTCREAYFTSPDLIRLVKHLVDYWYIITDPNTAPPLGPGHGEDHGDEQPPAEGHGDDHGAGRRRRRSSTKR